MNVPVANLEVEEETKAPPILSKKASSLSIGTWWYTVPLHPRASSDIEEHYATGETSFEVGEIDRHRMTVDVTAMEAVRQ
jgi:hypothetical protein